jgi:hypothetical protein
VGGGAFSQQIWMALAFKEIIKQTQFSGHLTAQPNDQKKTVKPNTYNSQTASIFHKFQTNNNNNKTNQVIL